MRAQGSLCSDARVQLIERGFKYARLCRHCPRVLSNFPHSSANCGMKTIYLSGGHLFASLSPSTRYPPRLFIPPSILSPRTAPLHATGIINLGEHNVTLCPNTAATVQLIRNVRECRISERGEGFSTTKGMSRKKLRNTRNVHLAVLTEFGLNLTPAKVLRPYFPRTLQ